MRTYSVPLPDVLLGVVVRPRQRGLEDSQTLLFFRDGIHILAGGNDGYTFKLGPQLRCTDSETGEAYVWSPHRRVAPAYDPATDCVYFFHKCGLMQLDANDVITLFAGSVDDPDDSDGIGPAARFGWPASTASDGRGCLYVCEEYWNGFRRVVVADSGGSPDRPVGSVETVHEVSHCKFVSLACPAAATGLLAASRNALYRIPFPTSSSAAADGGAAGAAAAGGAPELLAGSEEPSIIPATPASTPSSATPVDGPCESARFECISSLLAAPDGRSAYLVDGNQLRRVDLRPGAAAAAGEGEGEGEGEVVTVTSLRADSNDCLLAQLAPLPLPGGCLAVCVQQLKTLIILQDAEFAAVFGGGGGGVDSGSGGGFASAASGRLQPAPRPLAYLLLHPHPHHQQQPPHPHQEGDAPAAAPASASASASATVVVRVGGDRSFTAHRAVLADRSEYFAGLLQGGFREGGAEEVELPDADPVAFAALLSYMYTSVLPYGGSDDGGGGMTSEYDVLKEPRRVRAAAELAERLLLPGASAQLQRRLLAASTPASLLADLVWAERHGLRELAGRLKARMLGAQRARVRECCDPEAVRQLAVECPDVMAELFLAALG